MVTSRQHVCRISRNKMAWTDGNALEHFFLIIYQPYSITNVYYVMPITAINKAVTKLFQTYTIIHCCQH